MKTIEILLNKIIEDAFKKCGFDTKYAHVKESDRPDLAQFQCNGAMPLAKAQKKAPFLIADEIVAAIDDKSIFKSIDVIKPGFINITLTDEALAEKAQSFLSDDKFGYSRASQSESVVIDFGGPNVAKPMHVGHIRSTLIGDSLQKLYRYCGDKVISDVHLGDWGTQMGMLIEIIKEKQPDLAYFNPSYDGEYPESSPVTVQELSTLYPEASSRCKTDKNAMNKARLATAELQDGRKGYRALWRHFVNISIEALKKDFSQLGVTFDVWKGESDAFPYIENMIKDLKERGHAVKSDGAIVIESDHEGQPPLILKKSDGAVMYGTTDLATIIQRKEDFDVDKILYVVDKRQTLHFKQVFEAAVKTGISGGSEMHHIGFGTVNGKDGKPYKTRAGGVMKLSTLIEEALQKTNERYTGQDSSPQEREAIIYDIAMAAVKFADLSNVRTSDYIFDVEKFSQFEGKTGPYILYSSVRIKSMLRKADGVDMNGAEIIAPENDAERNLILRLAQFPNSIQRAYDKMEPHHLCDQAYSLAQSYSKFYTDCPILNNSNEEIKLSRLLLSKLALKQMEILLSLIGISIPEKM